MTAWLELLLLIAGLAAVVFLGLDLGKARRRRQRERRHLERLGTEAPPADSDAATAPGAVDRRLRAAGLDVGAPVWLGGTVLLALLVFLGVLSAFAGNLAAAVLAAVVAAWLPWSILGTWARRRARRFEEQLIDAVAFMAAALQAGENPTRALGSAAEATEGAAAIELKRAGDRLDAGTGIRRALAPMVAGYDSEGCRLFAQTLIAKWAAGGDLAPVLERVNRIMRERLAMRLRLRSELAGARLSAMIVVVLPYLLLPFLLARRPEWFRSLTQHPTGLQLLFIALLLQITGILWLRRIMRTDVG